MLSALPAGLGGGALSQGHRGLWRTPEIRQAPEAAASCPARRFSPPLGYSSLLNDVTLWSVYEYPEVRTLISLPVPSSATVESMPADRSDQPVVLFPTFTPTPD